MEMKRKRLKSRSLKKSCEKRNSKERKWPQKRGMKKKLSNWLEKGNIDINLSTAPNQELAKVLHRFYAESKADKIGQALSPSTLIGLRAGIQ